MTGVSLVKDDRFDAYDLENVQIDVIFYTLLAKGRDAAAFPILEQMADVRRNEGLTIAEEFMGERNGYHPPLIKYSKDENGIYHVSRNEDVLTNSERLEEFTKVCLDYKSGYSLPNFLYTGKNRHYVSRIIDADLSTEPGNIIDDVCKFVESILNTTADDALEFLRNSPEERVKEEIKWRLSDSTLHLTINHANETIDLNGRALCTATDFQLSPTFSVYSSGQYDLEHELTDWLDRGGSVPAILYGKFCELARETIEAVEAGTGKPMLFDNLILAHIAIKNMKENGFGIEDLFLEPTLVYPYEDTIEKYNREIKKHLTDEKCRELEGHLHQSTYKEHNCPTFVKIPNTGKHQDVMNALRKLSQQIYGNDIGLPVQEPEPEPVQEQPKKQRGFADLDIGH